MAQSTRDDIESGEIVSGNRESDSDSSDPEKDQIAYANFKRLYRKRDSTLHKRRTLEVVRSLYSVRKTLARIENDVSLSIPLSEAGKTYDGVSGDPDGRLRRILWSSIHDCGHFVDVELGQLYYQCQKTELEKKEKEPSKKQKISN